MLAPDQNGETRLHPSITTPSNPHFLSNASPHPPSLGMAASPHPPTTSGKQPRKWTSWGPQAAVAEGSPTAGVWGIPAARASALLRVDPSQSSETGTVRGLCWHNLLRERKGVLGGQDRALGGERPMGAAAYAGQGFKEKAAVGGEKPMGVTSCRLQHNQLSFLPPDLCPHQKRKTHSRRATPPPPPIADPSSTLPSRKVQRLLAFMIVQPNGRAFATNTFQMSVGQGGGPTPPSPQQSSCSSTCLPTPHRGGLRPLLAGMCAVGCRWVCTSQAAASGSWGGLPETDSMWPQTRGSG